MKKFKILINSIVLIMAMVIFTGCVGAIKDMSKKKETYKMLQTNGIYKLTELSDDKNKTYITTIKFLNNNAEKSKLEYSYFSISNNDNKILTQGSFKGGYNVHCHNQKCKIDFWNDSQKNGFTRYSVKIDKNNNLYRYSGGKITNYKFIKNK